MDEPELEERVTNLENLARTLEPLPQEVRALRHEMVDVKTRLTVVESQIVQLRGEMREGFSAIRGEMATKAELKQDISALSMEMAGHFLAAERKTLLLFEQFLGKRKTIDEGHPDA